MTAPSGNVTVRLASVEATPLTGSSTDAPDAVTNELSARQSPLNSRRFSGVLSSLFTWDHCAGLNPSSFAATANRSRCSCIAATVGSIKSRRRAPAKTSAKPTFGCNGTRYGPPQLTLQQRTLRLGLNTTET